MQAPTEFRLLRAELRGRSGLPWRVALVAGVTTALTAFTAALPAYAASFTAALEQAAYDVRLRRGVQQAPATVGCSALSGFEERRDELLRCGETALASPRTSPQATRTPANASASPQAGLLALKTGVPPVHVVDDDIDVGRVPGEVTGQHQMPSCTHPLR